jgi:nucleoid-associated protein YgaU
MANDDKPGIFESRELVREQAAHMAPADKADFSGVSSDVGSTVDRTGIYTVVAGDSLEGIAQRVYGDGSAWERIYAANRDQLTEPDKLAPGQVLKIPVRPRSQRNR